MAILSTVLGASLLNTQTNQAEKPAYCFFQYQFFHGKSSVKGNYSQAYSFELNFNYGQFCKQGIKQIRATWLSDGTIFIFTIAKVQGDR